MSFSTVFKYLLGFARDESSRHRGVGRGMMSPLARASPPRLEGVRPADWSHTLLSPRPYSSFRTTNLPQQLEWFVLIEWFVSTKSVGSNSKLFQNFVLIEQNMVRENWKLIYPCHEIKLASLPLAPLGFTYLNVPIIESIYYKAL